MLTAGDVVKDVYAFWGRPSEADLPQNDVITILNRKVNRLLLLSQLTDKNYLAVLSAPFQLSPSGSINIDELSTVVRVESRTIGTQGEWNEETITGYSSWNDVIEKGEDSVAFYGAAPATLKMAVSHDTTNLEFRILYETGGVRMSQFNTQVPVLQEFFRATLVYGTAADAGMQMNLNQADEASRDKKVAYAVAQEDRSVAEFQKWLLNEGGQTVTYREAFNSRRDGGWPRMNNDDQFGGYYSPY